MGTQIDKLIEDNLNNLKFYIINNIERNGQKSSGETQKSLKVKVASNKGVLSGRGYFSTLENGRKGGAVPKGFVDIIKQWIIDKGIQVEPIPYKRQAGGKYTPEERGLNSFAGAVAGMIKKNGTELHRFPNLKKDVYTNGIKEVEASISEAISKDYSIQFYDINQKIKEDTK